MEVDPEKATGALKEGAGHPGQKLEQFVINPDIVFHFFLGCRC